MVVFEQFTPSLQSLMKEVSNYEKKSKYFNCLWLMEELKKIIERVDVKSNPRLSLIEKLISFINIRQFPAGINDEYLYRFKFPATKVDTSSKKKNL